MTADDKKPTVKYDHNSGNLDNNITESYIAGYKGTVKYGIDRKFIILITFAVLLLIVGIVLIALANFNTCKADKSINTSERISNDLCDASDEASRIGLNKFLVKVKDVFHEVFPEEIAWLPEVTDEVIRTKFKVHDPRPENLKKIWDRANQLLNESIHLVCRYFYFRC